MTFTPGIPLATDKPSISRAQINTNFTQLNTVFNEDHITFNATTGRGEHQKITFNSVVADPGLGDPKASLYIKSDGTDSQLFFENYNNTTGANVQRQLSNLTVTSAGTNYGYTTPWGQIYNWGSFTCATTDTTVTYAVAFSAPPQTIQLTAVSDNGARNAVVRVSNAATAVCRATNNGLTIYYFAIGV